MMNIAMELDRYENIRMDQDVLFFRLGLPGLVCFHGNHYNIKKRMTEEQIEELKMDAAFYRISSNCYVNLKRISEIENDTIYFGDKGPEAKCLPISWRNQHALKSLL